LYHNQRPLVETNALQERVRVRGVGLVNLFC